MKTAPSGHFDRLSVRGLGWDAATKLISGVNGEGTYASGRKILIEGYQVKNALEAALPPHSRL